MCSSINAFTRVTTISRTGGAVVLKAADIVAFQAQQRGPVLTRASANYDVVRRIWNGAFDRHPAVIARCTGAPDLSGAGQVAARPGRPVPVGVQGG